MVPRPVSTISAAMRTYAADALAIALLLGLLVLTLLASELDHAIMSVLFFAGAAILHRRVANDLESPNTEVDIEGRLVGIGVLLNVAVFSYNFEADTLLASGSNRWLRLYPILATLGWVLTRRGFRGLRHEWRVPLLMFFLGVPWLLFRQFIDFAPITATAAKWGLNALGHPASIEAPLDLTIPNGRLHVDIGCSGLEAMSYLLGLAILAVMVFPPPKRWGYVVAPLFAMASAFTINVVRIVCLALFNASNKHALFESFHIGLGSQVFSSGMVGLFCGIYLLWSRPRSAGRHPVRSVTIRKGQATE